MPFESDVLEPPAVTSDVTDRRRPGRTVVATALLPLLRDPVGELPPDNDVPAEWAPREALAPSRGIALAVMLSVPVWCGIAGLLYSVMK